MTLDAAVWMGDRCQPCPIAALGHGTVTTPTSFYAEAGDLDGGSAFIPECWLEVRNTSMMLMVMIMTTTATRSMVIHRVIDARPTSTEASTSMEDR